MILLRVIVCHAAFSFLSSVLIAASSWLCVAFEILFVSGMSSFSVATAAILWVCVAVGFGALLIGLVFS